MKTPGKDDIICPINWPEKRVPDAFHVPAEGGFPPVNSDDELYSLYLAGDVSAADQLTVRYVGRLILYVDALIHDIRDAEDIVIETFAAIMTKRPAIREGGFQAYLYKAARNRAIRFDTVRRRLRVFSADEEAAKQMLTVRPEDEFIRDERRQAVQHCLNRIDPECREALWLTFFEGLNYREAAAVMGVNTKKVDNLLTKGKRSMRAELEKEGITRADES